MSTDISKTRIGENATLKDALEAITESATGVALVVGKEDRLVGILVDGDIRRALIAGAQLDDSVAHHMQTSFTAVDPDVGRSDVLDLMQARLLEQVPVVDRAGRLVGLHLIHQILGAVERPNWAVIMAGGRGRRLQPITDNLPKPMIKVAGRPIIERLLLHMVGYGFRAIYIAVNYLSHVIEDHFEDGSRFGCRIEYLRERDELGTGGALSLLPEKPEHPFLVLNGDLVTEVNLEHLLSFHEHGQYSITVGTRQYAHEVPFGCLKRRGDHVTSLVEKPVLKRSVNAGIYVFNPALISCVPSGFYPITNLIQQAIADGEPVGAFEVFEDWADVGQHEQLRHARGQHS